MIRNVNDVIEWLRLNEMKSWEVRTKDTDNAIVFQTMEGIPEETNFSNFQKNMELSKGGRYIIYASDSTNLKTSKKGRFREEFENLENVSSIGSVAPQFMGVPDGFVRREDVQAMIDKERMRNEMDRQKTEIEDLKEENRRLNEPIKKFMSNLSPIVAPVVSGLMQKFAPGTQIGMLPGSFAENEPKMNIPDEGEEINEEDDLKLRNALESWSNADPDFLLLIEKISDMAKSGNPFYSQAKEMLLKM
ncbi:MAG: hypothetical protein PHH93_13900 [Prolixibacteraceae bacterium]|nr:hypothetical protein [Prolixibacteraceae bacterium]